MVGFFIMKRHTKVYFNALGYDLEDPTEFIPSEISGMRSVDLHHIVDRQDIIENLMAVTREEHIKYGDKKKYMKDLLIIHMKFLVKNKVEFNRKYLIGLIKIYTR